MEKYQDRKEAGKLLAKHLAIYANKKDVIVLGLPRGGVPVASEVAKALHVPLDIFLVRKLGVPGHEELAMGAIAMGGVTVFNEEIVDHLNISKDDIQEVIREEKEELTRREKKYRGKKPFPDLKNKIVILIDDGIATGATMRAAIKALRQIKPAKIIVAVPVAEVTTVQAMIVIADSVICPEKPSHFYAVGAWYENFDQTTDEEVIRLLW